MNRLAQILICLAAIASTVACTKHDDTATASATGAPAVVTSDVETAATGALPAPTVLLFQKLRLPVYPRATVMDANDSNMPERVRQVRVELTSHDDVSVVTAWYKVHVDAAFTGTPKTVMGAPGFEYESIAKDLYPSRSIQVSSLNNAALGGKVTDIIIMGAVQGKAP